MSVCRDSGASSNLVVGQLRTENTVNPMGIDASVPRLNWQLVSSTRGVWQSAYQVRVAHAEDDLREGDHLLFDSGKVTSGQSIHVPYAGPAVESRGRYSWQVRVWDAADKPSSWSEIGSWEMGLLCRDDWTADWIDPGFPDELISPGPVAMLRKSFSLKGNIIRARAYVSALGLYELFLNGQRVGDQLFTPGWTSYKHRIQYQTFDVTELVGSGNNAVGALLGDGWYRGTIGWNDLPQRRHHYGDRVALLVQIEVTYSGGERQVITSDRNWRAARGCILFSDIYDGEKYDARLECVGWTRTGFNDDGWATTQVIRPDVGALIAPAGPPIRRAEEITPIQVFRTPRGLLVADMGQNMVGWVRLRVRGVGGTTVRLHHAEVLDQQGDFYVENLRSAKQIVEYTLKGGAEEVFEPHFTFQGFRYVAVEGYPGTLTNESLTGIVIHSNMPCTGRFETSDVLVNQLQRNIVWGQKGNFFSVPTDCPQRDERLAWTGDAQVFSATAAFNMDVHGFFTSWLGDIAAEQGANGAVPWVVPDILHTCILKPPALPVEKEIDAANAAGWSDAVTVIPWNLYVAYGDTRVLATFYQMMVRWVTYQVSRASNYIWSSDFQFGDWLDFFSQDKALPLGSTSNDLIATAYFAHSVDLLRRSAKVLGKEEDAARYADLFAHICEAFVRQFVAADGQVGEGTQTSQVLALEFNLLPEALRQRAAALLAKDVRARGHLTTGFLGTPKLLIVLSRFGYISEAYNLFTRSDYPSWLYPITRGATTIWERWDGIRPDGSFQNPTINSFNHYAYGAVGQWMYEVVAGLKPDPANPGYRHSVLAPKPGGGLRWVTCSLETPHGRLSSEWTLEGSHFNWAIHIPANTNATVYLPGARSAQVREGDGWLEGSVGIHSIKQEEQAVVLRVESGEYRFSYRWHES
jgi:alpha-L-rhamnosidase